MRYDCFKFIKFYCELPYFLIGILIILPAGLSAQQLYLNEVMASNGSSITDEDGDNEDWIELYYAGDEPLNLEGFGLSDDYGRPFRWEFPDVTAQPGEFLLVWASGKDRNDPGGELHANFSIASAGEELLLTAPGGERIDELEPVVIPTDISLGRYPDGTGEWYFYENPTPGEPNGPGGYQELLDPVTFSQEGGFYSSPFMLELTHPDPEVTIYYTLDGSEPGPENVGGQTYEYMGRYRPSGDLQTRSFETIEYKTEILVEGRANQPNYLSHMQSAFENSTEPYYFPSEPVYKGTVVRATAQKTGSVQAPVETNSYFVTEKAEGRYSLPVISIATQEDGLFGYQEGIYVPGKIYNEENPMQAQREEANYTQRGIEWERRASMEIFSEDNANTAHRQDMGIRIHGGASRAEPMKSLRLYARNQFGENRFRYPMFPTGPYNEYNRVILRNSGQDWGSTMFRDALMQRLVNHMAFDTQAYQPYITFINGEYWGIHNMRERYDKHYLARVHGIDPENIDLLTHKEIVKEGDDLHYRETLEYIRQHGLSGHEHYDYIQTRIDVENFIDYQIAQIFMANTDWPGNNIDYWRYRTDEYDSNAEGQADGRWRWLAFDMDFGFSFLSNPSLNTLARATQPDAPGWPNPPWSTELLREFLVNEQFQHAFINRYLDQLNTAFRPDRMVEVIGEMSSRIEPEMAEHVSRWNRPLGGVEGWQNRVDNDLIAFALERPGHARQHLKDFFDVEGEHEITVDISDPSMGSVRVNSIPIIGETPGVASNPLPWAGTYFAGIPVTISAEALPGHRFSHWEGIDEDEHLPTVERSLGQPLELTAVFEEDPDSGIFPQAFALYDGDYFFSEWAPGEPAGSYPDHMAFVYMDSRDPRLNAEIEGFTDGEYGIDSRTRINGLDGNGFAFINTGNEEGNPGYPGTRLGGAILALNTQGVEEVYVHWEGSTIRPNSRAYNLILQYRIGNEGEFKNVTDSGGNRVEYERNESEGHREWIGPVRLPEVMNNQAYVQLLWRYYYTGERLDAESGQRSKMAVPAIRVEASVATSADGEIAGIPDSYKLGANYPNPFNPATVIHYQLPESAHVRLDVFDITGRRVAALVDETRHAGNHKTTFDASGLASGVYIYRMQAGEFVQSQKMILVK